MKNLLYFGTDPDFYKELKSYIDLDGVGTFQIKQELYYKGAITSSCSHGAGQVVFLDFTNNFCIKDALKEIIFIKRIEFLKGILFVAIFADTESFEANKSVLTSGFQLFFIKGTETDVLIRDCLYIAFDDDPGFPALAKARVKSKMIDANACSTISSFGVNTATLETDLEWSQEMLNCHLPMFPDLTCGSFKLKDANHTCLQQPMTYSYSLELPLAGPWGEISSSVLEQDTIDTWKSLHHELRVVEPLYIKVFTRNRQFYHDVFMHLDFDKFHITFHDHVNLEAMQKDFQQKKHPIVFYDLKIDPANDDGLQDLLNLTISVFNGLSKPIIISTQNPSETQAIQKLFSYSNILSSGNELTKAVFFSILDNYAKKTGPDQEDTFFINSREPNSYVDVTFPVELTSLTEHEITFYSDVKLPMFSVLKFNLSIPFFATVVPSLIQLSNRNESIQYMAFINGVDDQNLPTLRKFINQIIYNPLDEFNPESITKLLMAKPVAPIDSAQKVIEKSEIIILEKKRVRFKGNSKL